MISVLVKLENPIDKKPRSGQFSVGKLEYEVVLSKVPFCIENQSLWEKLFSVMFPFYEGIRELFPFDCLSKEKTGSFVC